MKCFSRSLIFLVALLFSAAAARAQAVNWAQSVHNGPNSMWGLAEVRASAMDATGNLYVGGLSRGDLQIGNQLYPSSDSIQHASVIKYDPAGNVVWVRRYTASNYGMVEIRDMKLDASGNLFVTGEFTNTLVTDSLFITANQNQVDYYVMKWTSAGGLVWLQSGGGNGVKLPRSLAFDAAGNIYLGGEYRQPSNFGNITLTPAFPASQFASAFLARLSPTGTVLAAWTSVNAATNQYSRIRNIGTDQGGNIYLEGAFGGTFSWGGLTLTAGTQVTGSFWIKLNNNAQPVASFTNHQMLANTNTMVVDAAGYSYRANQFSGTINLGGISFTASGINRDTYVARYDPNGVLQWAQHLQATGTDQAVSSAKIALDGQGGVYLAGSFTGTALVGSQALTTSPDTSAAFAAAFDQLTGTPLWAIAGQGQHIVSGVSIAAGLAGQVGWSGNYFGGPVTMGGVVTGTQAPANTYSFYVARILQSYNTITGTVFLDSNGNGIQDATETGMPGGNMVQVNPGLTAYHTQANGTYAAATGLGSFTTSVPSVPLYHNLVPVGNTSATFGTYGNVSAGHSFALQPIANQQDLEVVLTPLQPARPGFVTSYRITFRNVGTVAIPAGSVSLSFDPLLTFLSTTQPHTLSGSTLSWAYTALEPGQTRNINALFSVPTSAVVGYALSATATVDPVAGDLTPADNTETNTRPITASYDPNMIEVNYQELSTQQVQDGQWLTYTIFFQNMGTDTAFTVMIRDSLDPEQLILNTVQLQAASHNCSWSVNSSGIMTVLFTNIRLPQQAVDVVRSNGFIRFRIRPQPSLAIGDIIPNRGHIYFDYNPAITTNTATTKVVFVSGTADNLAGKPAGLWPNPVHDVLNLRTDLATAGPVQISLSSMLGQVLYSRQVAADAGTFSRQIEMQHLPSGIYTLQLRTPDGVFKQLVVKN